MLQPEALCRERGETLQDERQVGKMALMGLIDSLESTFSEGLNGSRAGQNGLNTTIQRTIQPEPFENKKGIVGPLC